jgi:hypothetical protein
VISGVVGFLGLDSTVYFIVILGLVVLSSIAEGAIAAIVGYAFQYPRVNISLVKSGQGLSSILPSLLQLITRRKEQDILFVNLATAILCCLISLCGFWYMDNFSTQALSIGPVTEYPGHDELRPSEILKQKALELKQSFELVKIQSTCVFFNMLITLAVYPVITSKVKSVYGFQNLVQVHFIFFACAEFMGKSLPVFRRFRMESVRSLVCLSALRLMFIPYFLLLVIVPGFLNGYIYLAALTLFGLSNGLLNTNSFMQASTNDGNSDLMVFSLMFGLSVGGVVSFVMATLVFR